MQSSHTSLNLRSARVLDVVAFLVLDEDTRKQANHVGGVEENVGLVEGHALIESSSQMISPDSVLSTHVFLLAIILLLATEQQALCGRMSTGKVSCDNGHLLAVIFLFSRSTNSWKPNTTISGGFSG